MQNEEIGINISHQQVSDVEIPKKPSSAQKQSRFKGLEIATSKVSAEPSGSYFEGIEHRF